MKGDGGKMVLPAAFSWRRNSRKFCMYGFSSSAPMAACQEGCNAPGCWLGIKNSIESAGRSDIFVAMPANSGPIKTRIKTGLSARFVGMTHSHTTNRDKNVAPTKPSDPACLITTKLASLMFFPAHSFQPADEKIRSPCPDGPGKDRGARRALRSAGVNGIFQQG